jgi:uncharacterized protein YqhQ
MDKKELNNYGGQALIEGILMRGKKYVVASFRKPGGEIHIESEELTGIYKSKLGQLPLIRGLVILWDSLYLGMKYLTISANLQTEEDEKIEGAALFFTLAISILFAMFFFFILPLGLREFLNKYLDLTPLLLNIFEGLFRLLLLVGYIWVIGFSKDISRVFAYHGAEHKTINAYEKGVEINQNNVKQFPLAHPRCGTSFLLTLVVISILAFSLLGELTIIMRVVSRILAVPFLAMISYEVIRWLGTHQSNPFVKFVTYPNLLLQRLTTREPDTNIIEVAITAFEKLLVLENKK